MFPGSTDETHPSAEQKRVEAFEKIYRDNYRVVLNFILRMTGNIGIAEDIAHDAFILAFENFDRFRGESSVTTWLVSIAKNVSINHQYSRRRISFADFERIIETESSPFEDNPSRSVDKDDHLRQVKEGCLTGLLGCLSFNQRCAFILRIILGMSIREAAAVMSMSENSVRILIHRARFRLRRFLCSNCSLYAAGNRCRCEAMINFSMKKGLIGEIGFSADVGMAGGELRALGNEIMLYRSLPESNTDDLVERVRTLIGKPEFLIFKKKK